MIAGSFALAGAAIVALVSCNRGDQESAGPGRETPRDAGHAAARSAPSGSVGSEPGTAPDAGGASPHALDAKSFARLFRELSEPDRYYFSDNFVSNETSYLQVKNLIVEKAQKGAAYIGVGPEQNFTYIAQTEPKLAFIVDIRRQNALEHLLYKAIFEEARSRSEFLSLLLGSAYQPNDDPGAEASFDTLLARADAAWKKRKENAFRALHARLRERIESGYGIPLPKDDAKTLEHVHRAFFTRGLELEFELHGGDVKRDYPALRELLQAKAADGSLGNFLATELSFRRVQKLQREHRIIPVVGDFAGEHALRAIGAELRRRDLPVSVFYVSNVEQYVIEPQKWQKYVRNVEALPSNERSLFLRCYLDQGRRHPEQLRGHRTASVLQLFDHFRWRQRARAGYTSFWQLATDGVLGGDASVTPP